MKNSNDNNYSQGQLDHYSDQNNPNSDAYQAELDNDEPRRKQRGIVVGEEIYYTGGIHTPVTIIIKFHRLTDNLNRPKERGMYPAFQSRQSVKSKQR